jgi:hypothetical protein
MKKAIILIALVSLSVVGTSATEAPGKRITVAQAKALVLASLTPEQKHLPGVGAEGYNGKNFSKFMFFTVYWEGTPTGSVVVGNYAVDTYTGDVFSATAECKEEKNKNLAALQTRVRTTLRLSKSEYQRLKTKGPLCEE